MNIFCKLFGHKYPGLGLIRVTASIMVEINSPFNLKVWCKRRGCNHFRDIKEEVRLELEKEKIDAK